MPIPKVLALPITPEPRNHISHHPAAVSYADTGNRLAFGRTMISVYSLDIVNVTIYVEPAIFKAILCCHIADWCVLVRCKGFVTLTMLSNQLPSHAGCKPWLLSQHWRSCGLLKQRLPATTMGNLISQSFPPKSLFTVDQIPDLTGQVIIVTGYAERVVRQWAVLLTSTCIA
jgi:hypothetical protein